MKKFSAEQLETLRREYGGLRTIDPASPSYRRLRALLDLLPQPQLKQLEAARISFVSSLARNRLTKANPQRRARKNPTLPGINSAVYQDRVKWPKWNVKVGPLMDDRVGGALLRQRLPDWSKADHIAAAKQWRDVARDADRAWNQLVEKTHLATFGRPYQFTDYKISGIARDEYPTAAKNKLRNFAHLASSARSASAAHFRAAGKRGRLDTLENPSSRRSVKLRSGFRQGRNLGKRKRKALTRKQYRSGVTSPRAVGIKYWPNPARGVHSTRGFSREAALAFRKKERGSRRLTSTATGRYHVQLERKGRWHTIARFYMKPLAVDYARAMKRLHPKRNVRLAWD